VKIRGDSKRNRTDTRYCGAMSVNDPTSDADDLGMQLVVSTFCSSPLFVKPSR